MKTAVDAYFTENNLKKTGNTQLYVKAAVLLTVATGLYLTLLLVSMPVWAGILGSALLGLTLACIGFNVMHDACHGSFSTNNKVNDAFGLTLNALGGNAFIWKQKHNIVHHTYTNVDGMDDDIAKSPVMRHCHTQKWVPMHRIQHIYIPLVYAISSVAWVFIFDFIKYLSSKVYTTPLQSMKFSDHLTFWGSKLLYIIFYVCIPVYFVGWGSWAIGFVTMHIVLGFTLAIVFQLAHVVEETTFETVSGESTQIENEWAIHQIKTTANFSKDVKVISWMVGGLNYQIEHHLFPRISHVHYPAISNIVAQKCKEFGLPYNNLPTMRNAIVSHFRFIRALGMKPVPVPVSN
ncbi:fatty acid desaturase family protein [Chitinophaga costaii]|uniref:fatty acid desaturase family protein n=1 Tax=Chitinophaga costaii TaxID=1335309 RepID=UPI001F0B9E6E|nr:acyl-CoA desaturase [Chitinophaga costaii]